MTPAEFFASRDQMPERGQWSELVDGQPQHFTAPDVEHGDVLGNLTARLTPLVAVGTPVFRVGLLTGRQTLRFPAVSFFAAAGRFDLMDAESVEEPPAWVIEVASTPDRVRSVPERVAEYADMGVALVWVIDPAAGSVHTVGGSGPRVVSGDERLSARPVADLSVTPAQLCTQPAWSA